MNDIVGSQSRSYLNRLPSFLFISDQSMVGGLFGRSSPIVRIAGDRKDFTLHI